MNFKQSLSIKMLQKYRILKKCQLSKMHAQPKIYHFWNTFIIFYYG